MSARDDVPRPAGPARAAGAGAGDPDRGRRWALVACVAAPLVAGAVASGRVRAALVGAGGFSDGAVPPGPFPKSLRGPAGERVTLPAPPRRIVSTYLGADEILASLVDPARVRGVSAYADDPATSNCHGAFPPQIARWRNDPEAVLALDPDLVCVAGFIAADALRLMSCTGVPVLRWSRFESFADIAGEIDLIGAAVGEEARAAALTQGLRGLLADLERRLAGRRPVRVLYYDPPSFTMGSGTLVDEILTRAGAFNVVRELGIAGPGQIGIETVLALEPEAIVMPHYVDNTTHLRELATSGIWRQVPAVRAGKVYEIPGAWIATISHHGARGLERLARLLHPAAF